MLAKKYHVIKYTQREDYEEETLVNSYYEAGDALEDAADMNADFNKPRHVYYFASQYLPYERD